MKCNVKNIVKRMIKGLIVLCLLFSISLFVTCSFGRQYPRPTLYPDAVWSTEDGSIEFFVSENYLRLEKERWGLEANIFGLLRANGKEYPVIVDSNPEYRSFLFFTSLDIIEKREEVEQDEEGASLGKYELDYTILILEVKRGFRRYQVSATVNYAHIFRYSQAELLKQHEAQSIFPSDTKFVLHRKDDPEAVAAAYERFRAAYAAE